MRMLGLLLAAAAATPAGEGLESRVNLAIDRAAAHLESRQAADGSWQKEDAVHPKGRTALCAYALRHAGRAKEHPTILAALSFLDASGPIEAISTYEAACLVLFFHSLGERRKEDIHRLCQWLCDRFHNGAKLWGYPGGAPDLSNTQFAAMALKAGAQHGFRAPDKLWRGVVDGTLRLQAESGAFRYNPGRLWRATMTHAALLTILFAHEALGVKRPGREVAAAMERGHAWLDAHFSVERAPDGNGWNKGFFYYYLYGLERYGVLFGKTTIAGRDWYREGAEELLARQARDGGWGSLEDTAFAILFLRRATFSEPEERAAPPPPSGEIAGPAEAPRPEASIPFLRAWLVAGPYPERAGSDDMLSTQHFDVRRMQPAASGDAGRKRWEVLASPEDRVDVGGALGAAPYAAFYAAVWLESDATREAVVWIGSDDGCKLYCNGEEVLDGHHHEDSGADFYRVPVSLREGRNLLLLRIENLEYYANFQARLSDPEGRPLTGVETSTRRPAAKGRG